MPNIIFMYQGNDYYLAREVVCRKLTEAVATVISLPEEIQIRFANLGESVYGATSLDARFKNRVNISYALSIPELPSVLVHELIHLHQSSTGMLRTTRDGRYFWNNRQVAAEPNKMTHEEYLRLPWEIDASERHATVLKEALAYALKR